MIGFLSYNVFDRIVRNSFQVFKKMTVFFLILTRNTFLLVLHYFLFLFYVNRNWSYEFRIIGSLPYTRAIFYFYWTLSWRTAVRVAFVSTIGTTDVLMTISVLLMRIWPCIVMVIVVVILCYRCCVCINPEKSVHDNGTEFCIYRLNSATSLGGATARCGCIRSECKTVYACANT